MKKKYIAGLVAAGSIAIAVNSSVSLNASEQQSVKVFSDKHQSIEKNVCDVCELSLSNVFEMIGKRNIRDMNLLCSSADQMTHL